MNLASPLLAAGFGSIGMLAWAAAALIPLVLHLWNRRQHKTAPWAAMEFLLAAVQEQSKRMRIEQLLLLLLRMAIPIMLALALAEPIWELLPSLGGAFNSAAPQHHVFVIDTSYSMSYRVADRTRLDQAKQVAREIIEQSPQGDGFTLINMARPSESVVGLPAFSPDDINAEIANLQTQDSESDLASSLELVQQTIAKVTTDFKRLQRHRVYFLSDLGRTTWGAANTANVREQIGTIETKADIVTVDVSTANQQNAAITSLRRNSPVVTPTSNVVWQVGVEQLAGTPDGANDAEKTVELLIDGKLADKQKVLIESATPTSCSFQYQFDTAGEHAIEFRLEADELDVDNHRFEVVNVRDRLNVLCIEGQTGAARNVALALSPETDSNVEVRVVADHRMNETMLSDFDALFLCNVGRFTAESVTQLRDFLKRRKSVVWFLGDQVSIDNYNRLLADVDEPLLPGSLVEVAPYASYQFAPEAYRHPIISPFRGQEKSGLLTTPIWNYVRMQIDAEDENLANVVLKFTNGDPVILEQNVAGGRCIVFAIPASELSASRQGGQLRPWTAWSAWPSFPPIIQETLAFALTSQENSRNLLVHEPIAANLPSGSGAQYVTVADPASTTQRIAVQENVGSPTWLFDQTQRSGFYQATIADVSQSQYFAMNLGNSREGHLEQVNVGDLPSQFQQNSVQADSNEKPQSIGASRKPLFRMALTALLVLLFVESYYAWYLGNARS